MKKVVLIPGFIACQAIIMAGCSAYNTINVTQADGVDFRKSYRCTAQNSLSSRFGDILEVVCQIRANIDCHLVVYV